MAMSVGQRSYKMDGVTSADRLAGTYAALPIGVHQRRVQHPQLCNGEANLLEKCDFVLKQPARVPGVQTTT